MVANIALTAEVEDPVTVADALMMLKVPTFRNGEEDSETARKIYKEYKILRDLKVYLQVPENFVFFVNLSRRFGDFLSISKSRSL